MQKLMQKHRKFMRGDAGFSLVELIIVIAIMAALVAVLAPQYIKYVENSRKQVDESAVAEVIHAVELAIANEAIYNNLPTADFTVTVTSGGITDSIASTPVAAEVLTVMAAPTFKSKTHTTAATDTYIISVTYNAGAYRVTPYAAGTWS